MKKKAQSNSVGEQVCKLLTIEL